MGGRGRAAVCVALAALAAASGQTKCSGPDDCASRFGDNVVRWEPTDVKTWKRALELADWDVTTDSCGKRKDIIERTKEAAPAVFAAANNEDAPVTEYFYWADNLQYRRQAANGVHVTFVEVDAHLFMATANRMPPSSR